MSKTYRTLIEVDTKNAKKSINDLKREVEELTGRLDLLDESTEEYAKTQQQVRNSSQQLSQAMEKIQQDGELVGERMGHVTRIAAGLAGGFELVAGVMALAGKESEKYEEAMRRVAGAMAIANSVSALGDAFESLTKIFPAAGIAVENFGKKLKGVLTALKGWPGILLTVGAAVTAFFVNMQREANKAKKTIEGISTAARDSVKEDITAVIELKENLKALQGNKEALKSYFEENREEIEKITGKQEDFNTAVQIFINKTPQYIEALKKRAYAEAVSKRLAESKVEREVLLDKYGAYSEAGEQGKAQSLLKKSIRPLEREIELLNGELKSAATTAATAWNELTNAANAATAATEAAEEKAEKLATLAKEAAERAKELKKYREISKELNEFASIATKLSNIPIEGTLLSLINPDEIDISNIQRRNEEMENLADNVSRLQEKADSINLFNRFKGERQEATNYLRDLLSGHSEETTKLGSDREALDQKRAALEEEMSILDAESDAYREHQEEIASINQQIQDNLAETEAAIIANRRQGIQEIVDLAHTSADVVGGLMGGLGDLFDQGTAEYKAFKIAETVISTLSGSIKAFESLAPLPIVGPALGAAAAASVIATGIATVSQINQVEPGNTPVLNGSAMNMASTSPTIQSHVTGGDINTHQADNTKVYVLESDIRKTTNKVRVAESEARF